MLRREGCASSLGDSAMRDLLRLPPDWTIAPLGELVDPARPVVYGILMPGQGHPNGVPVVKVKDVKGGRIHLDDLLLTSPAIDRQYARSRLRRGDLLFTIRGTVGRTAFVPPQLDGANITQDSARLAITDGDASYIRSYLESAHPRSFIEIHTIGVAVKGINLRDVRRIPIPKPPLGEQKRIAGILDTVDEAIRKTEEIIAKLEQVKQGLLHDLLTRGIDDNGELRDPDRHPDQFKDSPCGRIPKAWDTSLLRNVAEVRSGIAKNSNRPVRDAIRVPYLRVANVQDGYLDLHEMAEIEVTRADLDRYRVLPGDVLMNEGGDLDKLGRGVLWRGQYDPCVHQNHVFVVRSGPDVLPAFLDAWTGAPPAKRYFMVAGKQTTNLASINKTALGGLPVLLPGLAEQRAIAHIIAAHEERATSESTGLAKLHLLKQGLMEDLLTGRVRVTALLEEAAE